MKTEPATINKMTIEKEMEYRGTPVLHYKIEYPKFHDPSGQLELEPINEWYRKQAAALQKKYETETYEEAVEHLKSSRKNHFPFHVFEAFSVYEGTYNKRDLMSLYYDHYTYTGGAHGNTVRVSDTWNMKNGTRINLYQFTTDPVRFTREILQEIDKQIEHKMETGEGGYFNDYLKLTAQYFDPDHFYLRPEGIAIFYQQYEIAPYASGIPEFVIS